MSENPEITFAVSCTLSSPFPRCISLAFITIVSPPNCLIARSNESLVLVEGFSKTISNNLSLPFDGSDTTTLPSLLCFAFLLFASERI